MKPKRNGHYRSQRTEKKQEEGKKRGQGMKGRKKRWQVLRQSVRSQDVSEGRTVDPAQKGEPSLSMQVQVLLI